jgi:hypothetical protein
MLLRSRESRWLAVLGAVFALAAANGCGGGSSDSEPLKRPEFVEKANAICLEADEDRKQGTEDLVDGEDARQSQITEALVAPVEAMSDELSELGPPPGDAKEVEAIVSAFEAGVAKLEADPTARGAATAFDRANELAKDYGLTDCTV